MLVEFYVKNLDVTEQCSFFLNKAKPEIYKFVN